MKWVDEVVSAFEALEGISHYSDIYKYIGENTTRDLPASWKDIIRKEVEYHSSDSSVFLGKEDYFFSIGKKGNGMWGLRSSLIEDPKTFDDDDYLAPKRELREVYRVIRNSSNAKKLKLLYGNSCQICGLRINLGNRYYSEAHHLQPLGGKHNGPDLIGNMIVVCPNHHAEFDFGAIAVIPKPLNIKHIISSNPINGKNLNVHDVHGLEPIFLKYHHENIFGFNNLE